MQEGVSCSFLFSTFDSGYILLLAWVNRLKERKKEREKEEREAFFCHDMMTYFGRGERGFMENLAFFFFFLRIVRKKGSQANQIKPSPFCSEMEDKSRDFGHDTDCSCKDQRGRVYLVTNSTFLLLLFLQCKDYC